MGLMTTIKVQKKQSDLAIQMAHISEIQSELARLQWQVIDIVKDPKVHFSPTILVTELLVVCLALLLAGAAIGMLL
jgi:hypothetical protein